MPLLYPLFVSFPSTPTGDVTADGFYSLTLVLLEVFLLKGDLIVGGFLSDTVGSGVLVFEPIKVTQVIPYKLVHVNY